MISRVALTIALCCAAGLGLAADAPAPTSDTVRDKEYETRAVTVRSGQASRTVTLEELANMPAAEVKEYQPIGTKRGALAKASWKGANLRDLLLSLDPALASETNVGKRIVLTSVDGYKTTLFWDEIFGAPKGGAALYNVKGCNECHGIEAEGSAPPGKRPAPALKGTAWSFDKVRKVLNDGGEAHGGLKPYGPDVLSDEHLKLLLDWCASGTVSTAYEVPAEKRFAILALEKDGKPATGKDGLIQFVVALDEFAGRFAHWVESIEVK